METFAARTCLISRLRVKDLGGGQLADAVVKDQFVATLASICYRHHLSKEPLRKFGCCLGHKNSRSAHSPAGEGGLPMEACLCYHHFLEDVP